MVEILSAAPGLAGAGASGLLLLLVMYLIKSNRDDRTQHKEIVAALREDHRKETEDLTAKLDRLEKRIEMLQKTIDEERGLRRGAEDRAARAEGRLHIVTGVAHDPATTWLAPSSGTPMVETRQEDTNRDSDYDGI